MSELLGLDISLTGTGYCRCDVDQREFNITGCGTIKTKPRDERTRGGKKEITYTYNNQERQQKILDVLMQESLLTSALVCCEDYAFGRGSTQLPEVQGVIRFLLHMNGKPWLPFAPGSIKKFASGKGNTSPDMMAMHVRQKFTNAIMLSGLEIVDNNTADAIAICALGHFFYRWFKKLPLDHEPTKDELKMLNLAVETNQVELTKRPFD